MARSFWGLAAAFPGNIALVCFFAAIFSPDDAQSTTSTASTKISFGSTSSLDISSSSCNFATLSDMRSAWSNPDELCGQKLPFEFWIYMKAEGTAEDPDASHVRMECLKPRDVGLVELATPEDWNSTTLNAAPGDLLRETKRSASYLVRSPLDFEAMCADDQVAKVSRVDAFVETSAFPRLKSKRRLQSTVSEAGTAHEVDALVAGLEKLGCQRTTGEDQTLCLMSDSFNRLGGQSALQESGDLPPDGFLTIVEDLPAIFDGTDEGSTRYWTYLEDYWPCAGRLSEVSAIGSAMTELAYDIAGGANFKFNTFVLGSLAAADDIIKLYTGEDEGGEACDVIVDDVTYLSEQTFRDGVISEALDEAVGAGTLYFASAGNYGNGYKFTSNWECESDLNSGSTVEPCEGVGSASHVFDTEATGIDRYFLFLTEVLLSNSTFYVHWDDDEGTSRIVTLEVLILGEDSEGELTIILDTTMAVSEPGSAVVFLRVTLPEILEGDVGYAVKISQMYSDLEDVEMRLISTDYGLLDDFSDGSVSGHKCATSIISVAAFDIVLASSVYQQERGHDDISGIGGEFDDPETGSVTLYSSRGPCYVNSGSGIETRLKPVTTAATGLQTSTDGFSVFEGTSASAPVAAAIATIVRAACYPREVTYDDMVEMLTDYRYTIDVTSDAGGESETWGAEAGYGIISANQMLDWIATNCQESCSEGGTLVDAGEKTTVAVIANAFDTRSSGNGCAPDGCTAANTRDGDISTRWSCKENLLDSNCQIMYTFEEPQDIVRMLIAFYKGDERTRELNVKLNGFTRSVIQSSGETDGFESFELETDETETLTLEAVNLRGDEWISITEVQFMVQ